VSCRVLRTPCSPFLLLVLLALSLVRCVSMLCLFCAYSLSVVAKQPQSFVPCIPAGLDNLDDDDFKATPEGHLSAAERL